MRGELVGMDYPLLWMIYAHTSAIALTNVGRAVAVAQMRVPPAGFGVVHIGHYLAELLGLLGVCGLPYGNHRKSHLCRSRLVY